MILLIARRNDNHCQVDHARSDMRSTIRSVLPAAAARFTRTPPDTAPAAVTCRKTACTWSTHVTWSARRARTRPRATRPARQRRRPRAARPPRPAPWPGRARRRARRPRRPRRRRRRRPPTGSYRPSRPWSAMDRSPRWVGCPQRPRRRCTVAYKGCDGQITEVGRLLRAAAAAVHCGVHGVGGI